MPARSVRASRPFHPAMIAGLAMVSGVLTGCSGLGGGGGSAPVVAATDPAVEQPAPSKVNPIAKAIFGGPSAGMVGAKVLDPADFQPASAVICPPVSIRPGTEQMTVTASNYKPDPLTNAGPPIVTLASIEKTARECNKLPDGNVSIKVGVIGRVVAGPAGRAGAVQVPLRIAVLQGSDKIVSSNLYKISVTLAEPTLSSAFSKVDNTISLPIAPGNSDYRILVGFDEGPAKKAPRNRAAASADDSAGY